MKANQPPLSGAQLPESNGTQGLQKANTERYWGASLSRLGPSLGGSRRPCSCRQDFVKRGIPRTAEPQSTCGLCVRSLSGPGSSNRAREGVQVAPEENTENTKFGISCALLP